MIHLFVSLLLCLLLSTVWNNIHIGDSIQVHLDEKVLSLRKVNRLDYRNNGSISSTLSLNHSRESNNPLSFVKQSTVYFPWNDGINYTTVCENLKYQLNRFKGPILIHRGIRGGLGHKFVSILHSITYALLVRRPLLCTIGLSIIHSCNVGHLLE